MARLTDAEREARRLDRATKQDEQIRAAALRLAARLVPFTDRQRERLRALLDLSGGSHHDPGPP